MKVSKEIFFLPEGNDYIIYAPLLRTIIKVNDQTVLLLKKIDNDEKIPNDYNTNSIIEQLKAIGIINQDDILPISQRSFDNYLPTSVTFIPTSDCNLNCIYCYANSGPSLLYLSPKIGKAAIDLICKNARQRKINRIQVGYLGGGEPFLAWDFVQELYDYTVNTAKQNGLTVFFTGVTNGMLPVNKVKWLSSHFQFLNISLDGNKEIQNKQRPTKSGGESFNSVKRTINILNSTNFDYSIRTTISQNSVSEMPEITNFFINVLKTKKIHFEPLFACGRCKTDMNMVPDPIEFSNMFKKSLDLINVKEVELFCSSSRLDSLSSTYCGALTENFYITPEGYVTACTEVSAISESLSKTFFIGQYDDSTNSFIFWQNKIESLMSRTVDKMTNCQGCIAKWHCSGGCPAKADNGDVFNNIDSDGCKIARDLVEYYIRNLEQGKINIPRINTQNN